MHLQHEEEDQYDLREYEVDKVKYMTILSPGHGPVSFFLNTYQGHKEIGKQHHPCIKSNPLLSAPFINYSS